MMILLIKLIWKFMGALQVVPHALDKAWFFFQSKKTNGNYSSNIVTSGIFVDIQFVSYYLSNFWYTSPNMSATPSSFSSTTLIWPSIRCPTLIKFSGNESTCPLVTFVIRFFKVDCWEWYPKPEWSLRQNLDGHQCPKKESTLSNVLVSNLMRKRFLVAHTTQPLISHAYSIDSGRESFPQGFPCNQYYPFSYLILT